MHLSYIGSGPYCYANAFAMMLGDQAPSTAVIELATGSPFGMQLIGGALPFFDPYGWTPEAGFDGALAALGWTSTVVKGKDAAGALVHLKEALLEGPVWVGPVEMGYLKYQPGKTGPYRTRRAFRRERGAEPRRDRAARKRRIGENVRDAELRGPSEAGRILEGAPCASRTGFLDVQTRQSLDA